MSRPDRIGALVLVVLLGGAGVALAQPQSGIVRPATEPSKPTVELGSELFAGNCASCHGVDGQGIKKPRRGSGRILGMGPSLVGVGAAAADLYLRSGFMPLANIHTQPTRSRVLFTGKEIRSLVLYVASLGPGPPVPHPDPAAGDPAQGLKLFTVHCAGCHQQLARGGFVTGARVPPLQDVSASQIASAVRVGPWLMPRFSKSQISDSQLNSIVRYVISTSHPDDRGGWGMSNLGPIPEGLIAWLAALFLVAICVVLGRRLSR